jgi:hypothetical protein
MKTAYGLISGEIEKSGEILEDASFSERVCILFPKSMHTFPEEDASFFLAIRPEMRKRRYLRRQILI